MDTNLRAQNRALLLGLFAGALLCAPVAQAGIKCWTNDQGVRECGSFVPPEYSQERVEVRNDQGVVVEVEPRAKTRAEVEAEQRRAAEEAAREAERKRHEAEQARQDRILLNTYLSERDILRSRDDKLSALEASAKLAEAESARQQQKLAQLEKRAAQLRAHQKTPPEDLQRDIDDLQGKLDRNREFIAGKRADQERLRREYAAQIARFRELKGSAERR